MTGGFDWFPVVVWACGGVGTLICGIAVGAWWASGRSSKIDQLAESVKVINARCDTQRASLLQDLEKTICNGIKAALAGLDAEWLKRNTETREDVAALKATVKQHDDDIREIFLKLGNPSNERGDAA